jgi:hypothetical protein
MDISSFQLGRRYSREEIHCILGGGSLQSYLIAQEGEITAGCFGTDLNPKAPLEVYPGFGPRIEQAAQLAYRQAEPFPVFLKRGNKAFEYVGVFEAYALSKEPSEIRAAELLAGRATVLPISAILRLRAVA